MKNCPACNTELKDECLFCTHCGFKFEQKRRCPRCGMEIEPNQSFCGRCGLNIKALPANNVTRVGVQKNNINTLPHNRELLQQNKAKGKKLTLWIGIPTVFITFLIIGIILVVKFGSSSEVSGDKDQNRFDKKYEADKDLEENRNDNYAKQEIIEEEKEILDYFLYCKDGRLYLSESETDEPILISNLFYSIDEDFISRFDDLDEYYGGETTHRFEVIDTTRCFGEMITYNKKSNRIFYPEGIYISEDWNLREGIQLRCKKLDSDVPEDVIDWNVWQYAVNNDGSMVTYLTINPTTEETHLYQKEFGSNWGDSIPVVWITDNVRNFYVNEDFSRLAYVTIDGDLYLRKNSINTYIDSEVRISYVSEDLSEIYYIKYNQLFKCDWDGKPVRLVSDFNNIVKIFSDGTFYYTRESELAKTSDDFYATRFSYYDLYYYDGLSEYALGKSVSYDYLYEDSHMDPNLTHYGESKSSKNVYAGNSKCLFFTSDAEEDNNEYVAVGNEVWSLDGEYINECVWKDECNGAYAILNADDTWSIYSFSIEDERFAKELLGNFDSQPILISYNSGEDYCYLLEKDFEKATLYRAQNVIAEDIFYEFDYILEAFNYNLAKHNRVDNSVFYYKGEIEDTSTALYVINDNNE